MNLNKLKIHTPEISKLKNLVETSQIWIEEAKSTIDCEVDLAKMNKLLYEARKINVNLDLYDTIKERQNLANTLINKIEITNIAADGKKTRSKQKRNPKKKIPKGEVLETLQELKQIKITSEKIDAVNEHLGKYI